MLTCVGFRVSVAHLSICLVGPEIFSLESFSPVWGALCTVPCWGGWPDVLAHSYCVMGECQHCVHGNGYRLHLLLVSSIAYSHIYTLSLVTQGLIMHHRLFQNSVAWEYRFHMLTFCGSGVWKWRSGDGLSVPARAGAHLGSWKAGVAGWLGERRHLEAHSLTDWATGLMARGPGLLTTCPQRPVPWVWLHSRGTAGPLGFFQDSLGSERKCPVDAVEASSLHHCFWVKVATSPSYSRRGHRPIPLMRTLLNNLGDITYLREHI